MYTVDAITEGYLNSTTRAYDLRLTIQDGEGSIEITQDSGKIFQVDWDGNIQHGDFLSLGSITARGLTLALSNDFTPPYNANIFVEIRLNGASGYGDWIPMGYFYIDKRIPSGDAVTLYSCYDATLYSDKPYVPTITFPATLQEIWDDLITQCNYYDYPELLDNPFTIDEAPVGYQCREMFGYLATINGGHFVIDREGYATIVKPYEKTTVDLTIGTDNWNQFERIDEFEKYVGRITCYYTTSRDSVTLGFDGAYHLEIECPFIDTEAKLQHVYDKYENFTFIPYRNLSWLGDPRIDLGDHVRVVDNNNPGTEYDCFIMDSNWNYGGALSMVNSGTVESETTSEFPPVSRIDRYMLDRSTFNDLRTEGRVQIHGANIIAGTLVAESIASDKGYIAELTVDELSTEDKVQNYLNSDTSDVNYVKIYDQFIEFITATTDGLSTEHASDRNGNLLYWTDDTYSVSSTEVTAYPVTIYVYDELEKMEIAFVDVLGTKTPVFTIGAGTGTGNNGKAFIYKGLDGLRFQYLDDTNGELRELLLGDNEIYFDFNGEQTSLVFHQDIAPVGVPSGSVHINSSDLSRYDIVTYTAADTHDLADGEMVRCTGTFTLTLGSIAAQTEKEGILVIVKNVGTGTITIDGDGSENIDGNATYQLSSQYDSVSLLSDGTNWMVI